MSMATFFNYSQYYKEGDVVNNLAACVHLKLVIYLLNFNYSNSFTPNKVNQ